MTEPGEPKDAESPVRVASRVCLIYALLGAVTSLFLHYYARIKFFHLYGDLGMDKLPALTELFYILSPTGFALLHGALLLALIVKEPLIRNPRVKLHVNMLALFGMVANALWGIVAYLMPVWEIQSNISR